MLSWLELLISRYCCIYLVVYIIYIIILLAGILFVFQTPVLVKRKKSLLLLKTIPCRISKIILEYGRKNTDNADETEPFYVTQPEWTFSMEQ